MHISHSGFTPLKLPNFHKSPHQWLQSYNFSSQRLFHFHINLQQRAFSTMIHSAVRAVRSYFRRDWDLESLVNVNNHDRPITPEILLHLEKVYLVLFWMLASFGFGYDFGLTGNIGHVGSSLFILWYPTTGPLGQEIRFHILIIGAMFGGSLVGPCFRPSLFADFGIRVIIAVFMWTFATQVFSFAAAAQFGLFSHSDHVWLNNPLRLGLIYLAVLIFAGDPYLEICNMIVWFVAYVAVFSRLLVQRIRDGDDDFVIHAITFFTDAPAVCIHMVNLVFWGAWDLSKRLGRGSL